MMDEDTLKKVAQNAHLELTEEELVEFRDELNEILDHLSILDEVPENDRFGLDPIGVTDAVRDDIPEMRIDPELLLKDTDTYDDHVRGPRLQ